MGSDLRHALRALVGAPAFSLAAILSLALGIGASSAVFSVASALLLRPLPYADPHRLVILWNTSPGLGITEDWFSTAQYADIREQVTGLDQLAIAIGGNENLTGYGDPARVGVIRASSNLLPMLGARAQLGRLFLPEDDLPGREGTAVLGHGAWARRFGADPGIVGRAITLNGLPYTVVGVLPAAFSLPREVLPTLGGADNADVLLPLPLGSEAATVRRGEDYNLVARLAPGATVAGVQAEMDALTARLRQRFPEFYPPNGGLTFTVTPLHEQVVGDVRRPLGILLGAVGLLLVIASVNVASLQLARAAGRQRELAVRAALGAGRWPLSRLLLAESLLLAVAGGAIGLLVAAWSLDGIRALGEGSVPRLGEVAIDFRVLAFAAVVTVGAGVISGLVPLLRTRRVAVSETLKNSARGAIASGRARRDRLRRALVIGEVAMAVALAAGAVLLVRSFVEAQRVPPGFDASGVLTLELTMAGPTYGEPVAVLDAYRRIWEAVGTMPGVDAVGGVTSLPMSRMMAWGPITVEGRVPEPGEAFVNVDLRVAGGGYFEAMRIPLLRGRLFDAGDHRDAARVVVIDRRMADTLWPGDDAIGRRVRRGGFDASASSPWLTVVGIVGHVKQDGLDQDSRMAMYLPHLQYPARAMSLVVRAAVPPETLAEPVRRQVQGVDAGLPVFRVKTMEARVAESLATRRFAMLLLALFASVAVVMAMVGVYGVVATFVSHGTRELGIRMALGASPGAILRLVVGHGAWMTGLGLAGGLAAAWGLSRFLEGLLFGVTARDLLTFAAVPFVLGLVALAACYLPARRAARIDPTVSLRAE